MTADHIHRWEQDDPENGVVWQAFTCTDLEVDGIRYRRSFTELFRRSMFEVLPDVPEDGPASFRYSVDEDVDERAWLDHGLIVPRGQS
jgi:hypothetical protein